MTERFALPEIGDLLAEKYRVLRVVADGGMGVVFEAHHELLGKNVALKFPLPELVHLPSVVERFLAEARLCARIENEHVVRVLDVSKLAGLPYIVMELVSGASLAREMGTPWPPAKAAAFAVQVLEGLEAVHALGVVHRDVKPENVLVVATARGPLLKLIDFGIAKDSIAEQVIGRLTRAGALLGTPAYMAPEQIRDPLHAGSSVDLYSVGILLFEMLAGASPFTATNVYELAQQAVTGQLRSLSELAPSTPGELVAVVTRATALNAADRFASASDFKEALSRFAEGWALRDTNARGAFSQPEIQPQVALRTEYAEPPTFGGGAPRTEYAEPSMRGGTTSGAVTNTVAAPAPALPIAREANHGRVLASVAVGVIAVLGLALAVRAHQKAEQGAAPPPIATLAPETVIAPLDSESADSDAAGGAPKKPAKSPETRSTASPQTRSTASPTARPVEPPTARPVEPPTARPVEPIAPPVEPMSVVQVDGRRFRSCNSDGEASDVVVDAHVAPDGSVQSANVVNSSASAPVTDCVLARVRALQFPPHEGAEEVARIPVELPARSEDEPREHRRRPSWLRQRFSRDSE